MTTRKSPEAREVNYERRINERIRQSIRKAVRREQVRSGWRAVA